MITLHGWLAVGFILLMVAPWVLALYLTAEWAMDRITASMTAARQREIETIQRRTEPEDPILRDLGH